MKRDYIINKLQREISVLQDEYDKYENNAVKQSEITNAITLKSKQLKLWKDLYAVLDEY
jgi:iron-sulfur cluster repair protein YtfE (RIC family)